MRKVSIDSCFLVQHAFFLGRMAYPARHTYVDAEIVLSQFAIYLCAPLERLRPLPDRSTRARDREKEKASLTSFRLRHVDLFHTHTHKDRVS